MTSSRVPGSRPGRLNFIVGHPDGIRVRGLSQCLSDLGAEPGVMGCGFVRAPLSFGRVRPPAFLLSGLLR